MQLTEKDKATARRLAKCLTDGMIPVNQVREFLEKIGRKDSAQSKPRKVSRLTELKNHYKSIL